MWEVSQLSACQELDRQRLFSCTACTYFFSSMEERQLSISRQHKRWQPLLAAVEILAIVNATTMNQLARVEDGKESFCSWSDTYLQVLNGVSFLFFIRCCLSCVKGTSWLFLDGQLRQALHLQQCKTACDGLTDIWSDSDCAMDACLTLMPHFHFDVTFEIKAGSPKMHAHAKA